MSTTAAPEQPDAAAMRALLETLPQEIYDNIVELTLALDLDPDPQSITDWTVTINWTYKSPVQLQLNRAIRKRVSGSYFHNTAFSVSGEGDPTEHVLLHTWMNSLPEDVAAAVWHVSMRKQILQPQQQHSCLQSPPRISWTLIYKMSSHLSSKQFQGKEDGLEKIKSLWRGRGRRISCRMWRR